jgi:hypothetical protein
MAPFTLNGLLLGDRILFWHGRFGRDSERTVMTKSYYYLWFSIWFILTVLQVVVIVCWYAEGREDLMAFQTLMFVLVMNGMINHICKRSEVKEDDGQD